MGVKRSRRPTCSSLSVPLPVCSSIPGKRECNVKPAGIKRFPRMDYLPRLRYLSQFCLQFYYFWRKKTLGSLRKDRLPRPVFLLLLVPFWRHIPSRIKRLPVISYLLISSCTHVTQYLLVERGIWFIGKLECFSWLLSLYLLYWQCQKFIMLKIPIGPGGAMGLPGLFSKLKAVKHQACWICSYFAALCILVTKTCLRS